MIKVTVAQVKQIGEGDNKFGHWVNRVITFQDKLKIFDQDGTEHDFPTGSTLDEIAGTLNPGDVIEAEAEINGKYLNLKKIAKIALVGGQASTPASRVEEPPGKAPPSRDDIITGQVAFKGVIDLLCAKVIDLNHPWAKGVSRFLGNHLTGGVQPIPEVTKAPNKPSEVETKGSGQEGTPDLYKLEFANPGEFYAACVKHKGFVKSLVDKELKGKYNLAEPDQRLQAWQFIVGLPSKVKGGSIDRA